MNQNAFDRSHPFQHKKIAVLMGGLSNERDISLMSGQAVLQALQGLGLNAHGFDPATRPLWALQEEGFEVCMLHLHGRWGEDGTVQGALELMGIPYTGSGVQASSIAIDKCMTKRLWQTQGIPTPPWRVSGSIAQTTEAFEAFAREGHRMIVKPVLEGSSVGLTRVSDASQCAAAFAAATAGAAATTKAQAQALCEAWIEGPELTAGILTMPTGAAQVLPLIGIAAPQGHYDYQNKYFSDAVQYHLPCGLPPAEQQAIAQWALRAFETLHCRGWARVDVMIDAATRRPYLLEINTSPGMTSHSLLPMAARAIGMDFSRLCLHLLASARLDHAAPSQAQAQAHPRPHPQGALSP